jgi:exopolysaccharide biosynthesis polyprenyl glycosylphosphotransferase
VATIPAYASGKALPQKDNFELDPPARAGRNNGHETALAPARLELVPVEQLRTRVDEPDSLREVRIRERVFRRSLAAADMLAAAFAVFVSITLSAGETLRPTYLLVMPLVAIVAKLQGLYDRDELIIHKTTLDELPRLVNLATLFALLVWLSRHFIVIGAPTTKSLLLLWFSLLAMLTLGRMIARAVAGHVSPRERCFVIGDAQMFERVASKFDHSAHADLVGTIRGDDADLSDASLRELMRRYHVHRIIIGLGNTLDEEQTLDLVRLAKGIGMRVTLVPSVLAVVGSSVVFDDLWGMQVLGIQRFGLTRSSEAVKRAFDLVGAGLGLLLISPLLAVISISIKRDSRGPVLFRQQRIGRAGAPFTILKFRTMVLGADAMKGDLVDRNEADGLFKIANDPRVTRVGRFLRRSSLDELPQLFNVLRGEMSLVGPRPLILDEDAMITGYDRRRLSLTPGMTGHWQILGSARVPLREMVKLDYLYVTNWSLWNDVKILVRTVGVVARRRGI